MTQPLLSIQFPYTKERQEQLDKLVAEMAKQITKFAYNHYVVFEFDDRDKEISIGEKRNDLYQRSAGKYTVQWDSDDWVSEDGIPTIITALLSRPDVDCCTYEEYIDINGKIQRSNHSLKYDDWHDNFDGYDYVRTPFMKSVIKTEIAKSVPVPFQRFGEDHLWAKALYPYLKNEIHIPEQIYKYIHRSSNHNERYGIKD